MLDLPPKYRQILLLREFEQLSVHEAAERLDSTIPAVKTRLFRGRAMLHAALRLSGRRKVLSAA